MDMDRFTDKAQEAIGAAQEIALRMNHQQVDGEHLHMALLTQEEGLIPRLISFTGVDIGLLISDVQRELDKLPAVYGTGASGLYASRRLNSILLQASDEAGRFKDEYVGVEHIYGTAEGKKHAFGRYSQEKRDQQGKFPFCPQQGEEQSADYI